MPNISDYEYNELLGRKRVADFSEDLFNDPMTGKDIKRLIKRKHPHLPIPDLDLEDKFEAQRAADKKEREDRERSEKEKKQQDEWKEQRARTQKDWGFTEETMANLEKTMVERNIGDYEVAATFHAAKNPKPSEPTSHHGEPWGYAANETFREVSKDPEGWAKGEMMKAMKIDRERELQQR